MKVSVVTTTARWALTRRRWPKLSFSNPDVLKRHFLSFIEKTNSCWIWKGTCWQKSDYAKITVDQRPIKASQVAFRLFIGPIPSGICVCHKCDNRRCVQPDHLFLGTNEENTYDRHKKGRDARGEGHGRAKLNDMAIKEIRMLSITCTKSFIARKFKVSHNTIGRIVQGKTWRHVA